MNMTLFKQAMNRRNVLKSLSVGTIAAVWPFTVGGSEDIDSARERLTLNQSESDILHWKRRKRWSLIANDEESAFEVILWEFSTAKDAERAAYLHAEWRMDAFGHQLSEYDIDGIPTLSSFGLVWMVFGYLEERLVRIVTFSDAERDHLSKLLRSTLQNGKPDRLEGFETNELEFED